MAVQMQQTHQSLSAILEAAEGLLRKHEQGRLDPRKVESEFVKAASQSSDVQHFSRQAKAGGRATGIQDYEAQLLAAGYELRSAQLLLAANAVLSGPSQASPDRGPARVERRHRSGKGPRNGIRPR